MERSSVLITSLVAIAIVFTVDVIYVGVINSQGPPPDLYTPRFVASYLAVLGALVVVSLVPRHEIAVIRVPLRAAAAAGLLVVVFVSAFSIGPPLALAGFLVFFALVRTARPPGSVPRWSGLVAAALAVVLLIGGFEVTQRLIVCPASGQLSVDGSGFVTGPYHYECVDGALHWRSEIRRFDQNARIDVGR